MKKTLGIFFILIAIAMMVVMNLPAVSSLKSYPSQTLEHEAYQIKIQIDALSLSNDSIHQDQKNRLQKQYAFYEIELYRRNLALGWVGLLLGLAGIGLVVSNLIKKRKISEKVSRSVKVSELMPTEVYVDDAEYFRRRGEGFISREQALDWFEVDPLRVCAYCGANGMKPVRGKQDAIQLVTFYKKVPDGAKDLRIIWGSSWQIRPASQLECENCHHKINR